MVDAQGFSRRLAQAIGGRKKQEVAKATGITPQQLSKYLHKQLPSVDVLARLASALNCSTDWLLVGKQYHVEQQRHRDDIAYLKARLVEQRPDIVVLFDQWCASDRKSQSTILRFSSILHKARKKTRMWVAELSMILEEREERS